MGRCTTWTIGTWTVTATRANYCVCGETVAAVSLNDLLGYLNAILNENLNRARTEAPSSRPVRQVRRRTRRWHRLPAGVDERAATTRSKFTAPNETRLPGISRSGSL